MIAGQLDIYKMSQTATDECNAKYFSPWILKNYLHQIHGVRLQDIQQCKSTHRVQTKVTVQRQIMLWKITLCSDRSQYTLNINPSMFAILIHITG